MGDIVSDSITQAESALNEASPVAGVVADLLVGDAVDLAKATANLTKDQSWGAIAGAIGALAIFSLNFVPFGMGAKIACRSLGKCLARAVGKKLFTKALETKMAKACIHALEREMKKGLDMTSVEAINLVKRKAVSEVVQKEVSKIVEKDLLDILNALNSKFVTEGSLTKKLVSIGVDKGEAKSLAADLIKNKFGQHVKKNRSLAKMQDILTESITKELKEDFNERLANGTFGKEFSQRWGQHISKLEREGKIGKEVAEDVRKTALDKHFVEGFEEGIEKGVKEGVQRAIRKFKKHRDINLLRESYARDSEGMPIMPTAESRGSLGGAGMGYGYKFRNLADSWKYRRAKAGKNGSGNTTHHHGAEGAEGANGKPDSSNGIEFDEKGEKV